MTGSRKAGEGVTEIQLPRLFCIFKLIELYRTLQLLTTLSKMASSNDVHENVKVILFSMATFIVQNFCIYKCK